MKSSFWSKVLPHVIAIGIFLIISVIFCEPSLHNKVLHQEDMVGFKGMIQNTIEHKAKTGESSLWTPSMFSGMPIFIMGADAPTWLGEGINKVFTLCLPQPIQYFFLCCICFYIFCMCLRINPYVAIIGSLAYAFCTYMPIIAVAGHVTKIWAMAYAPALLGSVLLLYRGKYLTGFILTALFTMMQIGRNHIQISYYLFIIIAIMTVFYIIKWIKDKQYSHAFKSLSLAVVAATLGVLTFSVNLFTTYDYSQYSKRGKELLTLKAPTDSTSNNANDKVESENRLREWAFQWSYGKAETFTLIYPGVQGYGAMGAVINDKSHLTGYLKNTLNLPDEQALQTAQSMASTLYWGDQTFTVGPVYLGAVVCFLFIFGMVYIRSKDKWWLFAACIAGIILALGHNLSGINYFLFDHLPFYSKFRAPSMALVIPQLILPIVGVLALQQLITSSEDKKAVLKSFKLSLVITAAVFAIGVMMYTQMDYIKVSTNRMQAFNGIISSPDAQQNLNQKLDSLNKKIEPLIDNRIYENIIFQSNGNKDVAQGVLSAIRKDRAAVFGNDILRSFIYILLAACLLWLFISKKVNSAIFLAGTGLFMMVDLFTMDKRFFGEEHFVDPDEIETQSFIQTAADAQIVADKEPDFRVFNRSTGKDPFQESGTSYYHNSIGGYSPAKIGIYDDLITYQLSGAPNPQVLNMLNTKYIIVPNGQQKDTALVNPNALGPCWIVKGVKWVNNPSDEMRALYNFSPKDTVVIDKKFSNELFKNIQYDSLATIKLMKFDNDKITYESSASSPQVAVLSEVYYPGGWNVYIDNKKGSYFKSDYVLRGIVIPEGKHTIEFKFEPLSYKYGYATALCSNILMLLCLLGYVGMVTFKKKDNDNKNTKVA